MIRAESLSLRRGSKVLLERTDFVIHPGERLGIVGKNGTGKTSLFAVLQGKLDIDSGTLEIPHTWRIASVEQIISDLDRPAREFVIDGDQHLRRLQHERRYVDESEGERIAELEAQLQEAGAWSAASRAEQLLAGLGFSADEWLQPVHTFSGGWQMRVALARALMAPSDLLLLDEPTNHLDLDAVLWLERWITAYPGTILIISHDTDFLEATAQHILHFEQQQLVRYRGSYESFQTQRAQRLEQLSKAHQRQQQQVAGLQSFIDRFKAQASKARQAQSRIKALERMQELAPLYAEHRIAIQLPPPERLPDPLLILSEADLGYTSAEGEETRTVIHNADLMVRSAERIGILGVNGAGKSTLVKTLAGVLSPLKGQRQASAGLEIGYFAQQQLDLLDSQASALQHLAIIAPEVREQNLRNYLAGFGFVGDTVHAPVGPFSGGEKARLALALIVWNKPNLLLLDEPSNHLDTDTRESLAEALAGFEGSVLLVSHDRHLLRTTADRFWIVADETVSEFDGDLDDYRRWLATRTSEQRQAVSAVDSTLDAATSRRAIRREQAQARQELAKQRRPLEQQLASLETDIAMHSARLQELNEQIVNPDFYTEAYRTKRIAVLAEHGELSKQLDALEEDWLDVQEKLDVLTTN